MRMLPPTVVALLSLLGCLSASAQETCRLEDVVKLDTAGPAIAPRLSPDGTRLLFSRLKYRGAYVLDFATGTIRTVSDTDRVGHDAHWTPDSEVSLSARVQHSAVTGCTYGQSGDAIVQECNGAHEALTDSSDRFFGAVLSPDGRWLAYRGVATGMHLLDLRFGSRRSLGSGAKPAWSPDSRKLFYNISTDDGLKITGSELWVHELAVASSSALVSTARSAKMFPTTNGTILVYEDRCALFAARLTCTDRKQGN